MNLPPMNATALPHGTQRRARIPAGLFAIVLTVLFVADAAAAEKPRFQLDGEKWNYTSAERSFSGFLLKPDGNGPFPAVIINHGKGGRPDQFSLNWAREMVQWGLVCICPTLTHVAGTDIQGQDGASEENIGRARDCLAILEQLGYVDLHRVAVTGHSMGSFLTIGFCGTVGTKIKAAAISAGGVSTREGFAMPTTTLASQITAPFLILHGTVDQAVPYPSSKLLQETLTKKNIATRHVTFVGTDHGLPTLPATKAVVLALIREWFAEHGVLEVGKNAAPTITPPANHTAPASAGQASLEFSVQDRDTKPEALTVTATSSNPKVLPPANLVITGTGAERTLVATPAAGEAGPATVLLTVSDGQRVATSSFVLGFANTEGVVPEPVVQRIFPGGRGPGAPKKK